MYKHLFATILLFIITINLLAQDEIPMPKVPAMRQLFHLNINNALHKIIRLNSKDDTDDTIFNATSNPKINSQLTKFLKVHVNNLQANIEIDSTLSESDKFIWLRAVENLLNDYIFDYNSRQLTGIQLKSVMIAFEQAMALEKQRASFYPVISNNPLEIGNIILHNPAFANNVGFKPSRDNIVLKLCQHQPDNIMRILTNYPNVYFVDSIITEMAYKNQEEMYNYASSPNELGDSIRSCTDPLVKMISQLSSKKTGRMYFPFLDVLYKGEVPIDTVTNALDNDEKYYKLLVRTEIEYAERMRQADTPLVYKTLVEKLKGKAVDIYIDEINALHDEKLDEVRFKKIENLSPVELYYLCVLGEEEIYTSSYLGVYKRIFERMKVQRSDAILDLTNYDFYKKFIKMAAAYNQLDDFLKRMDTITSNNIMRNFVSNLDAKNTLEDAVDVADSYASITNVKIRNLILDQIQKNLFEDTSISKRSETIYRLLFTIFLSMDSANHIDLTKQLGINPIFFMPNKLLQDTSGRIVIQQFFYGDKDGKNVFKSFLENFHKENWRITQTDEWAEVRSIRGTKILIYANKPLDAEQDLDAAAQSHLINYLDSCQLSPTVVIHRGHSYYLKYTIDQLNPSARIVLLGSCGGYQSLNQVLEICPEAHIIASKQVGTGIINQGLINVITEQLRLGKDLNWPLLWKGLTAKFGTVEEKEKFSDYIPPYKNLGAIFLMAYQKAFDGQ